MTTTLQGASNWERELYEHLTGHQAAEEGLISRYRQARDDSDSEAFRYLIGLILEDEDRHHRFTVEIINALRGDVEMVDPGPRVPLLQAWKPVDPALVAATEDFLKLEKEDGRELKRLARDLRDAKDTTLWHLLVRVMEADTGKHVEILTFLRDHLRA